MSCARAGGTGTKRGTCPHPLGSCCTYPACYRTQLSPDKGCLNSLQGEQEPGVSLPMGGQALLSTAKAPLSRLGGKVPEEWGIHPLMPGSLPHHCTRTKQAPEPSPASLPPLLVTHSFNNYLLSACCVPGAVLCLQDMDTDKVNPCF